MNKELETQITFTPYTIDTYQTFTFERSEESMLDNGELEYDDYDWTYDTQGYIQALADSWLKLMQDNILDDVIKNVKLDGKAYSPREYNFTTDNSQVVFEVDIVKLKQYIVNNQADYDKTHIRSYDGFMYFGNEDDTMLHYYLHNKSIEDYTFESYLYDQYEQVEPSEFIDYKLINKD